MHHTRSSFVALLALALPLLPTAALAAGGGDDIGLGAVTEQIKAIARWIFVDVGPYFGAVFLGVLILVGAGGHMEWKKVVYSAIAIIVFFFIPKFVFKAKESAADSLDQLGRIEQTVKPDARRWS